MLTTDIIPNISVKFGSQIFLQKKCSKFIRKDFENRFQYLLTDFEKFQ